MDVIISENMAGSAVDVLRRDWNVAFEPDLWREPELLQEKIRTARALIIRNKTRVTADLIAAARQLEIVGRAGAGLDNIDVQAATESGIVVTYAPNENSVSVAELTIGMMLALARKIPAANADTCRGGWDRNAFTGTELAGKTLGIVGLGRIGVLVARRAAAFEMNLVAHDQFVNPNSDQIGRLNVRLIPLDDLLRDADFVVCHVPLTEQTRSMFNAARFRQMKPTASFINTSRGEVVDETALIDALRDRRLAGAALDVREIEPPSPSPLNDIEEVILTPHIAAFTREAQDRVTAAVCRDVTAVLHGEHAQNAINFNRPRRESNGK